MTKDKQDIVSKVRRQYAAFLANVMIGLDDDVRWNVLRLLAIDAHAMLAVTPAPPEAEPVSPPPFK